MENLSFEYKLYKAHRNEKNIFLKRALRLKLPAGFLICNIISLTHQIKFYNEMGKMFFRFPSILERTETFPLNEILCSLNK